MNKLTDVVLAKMQAFADKQVGVFTQDSMWLGVKDGILEAVDNTIVQAAQVDEARRLEVQPTPEALEAVQDREDLARALFKAGDRRLTDRGNGIVRRLKAGQSQLFEMLGDIIPLGNKDRCSVGEMGDEEWARWWENHEDHRKAVERAFADDRVFYEALTAHTRKGLKTKEFAGSFENPFGADEPD